MKQLGLLLLVGVLGAAAQNPPQGGQLPPGMPVKQMTNLVERASAPTYSDLNCAGYLSKKPVNASNYVIGGQDSPVTSLYGEGSTLFLNGSGYQEGQRYSIVRAVRDANRMEMYRGQHAELAAAGQPYQEMGHVQVTHLRGSVAIATVEFSCGPITPGDYVVPFQERAQVSYRPESAFDEWPTGTPALKARIVLSRDFGTVAGTGDTVYLNVGADKGVKPGDYFRVVRSYDPETMDAIEAMSYKQPPAEETQMNSAKPPNSRFKNFPLQAIGEMIVLNVTPSSATAMVTLSKRSINVGDEVQLEGAPAAPAPNGQR